MNIRVDQLGELLFESFEKIRIQLSEKLKAQLNGVLKTDHGDYEIVKIDRINFDEIYIENEKIHNLFSPNGFKISGTFLLKVQAYTPSSDKNSYTAHAFVIRFKPTLMKFHFDKETFTVEENIDISYISKESLERMFF